MFQAERGYKMGTVLLLKFTFFPISTSAYYGLAFASLYTQNLVCELLWKLFNMISCFSILQLLISIRLQIVISSLFNTYWYSCISTRISNKLHVIGFISLSEVFQVLVCIEYSIYLLQGLSKCTEQPVNQKIICGQYD